MSLLEKCNELQTGHFYIEAENSKSKLLQWKRYMAEVKVIRDALIGKLDTVELCTIVEKNLHARD